MVKNEELLKMFEGSEGMDNQKAIAWAMDKYHYTRTTATTYYYKWKKLYMHGANCIPKDVKKTMNIDTSKTAQALVDMADKWHKVELKDGRGCPEKKLIDEANPEPNVDTKLKEATTEIGKVKVAAETVIETAKELQVIQPNEEYKPLDEVCVREKKLAFKDTEINFEGGNGHYNIKDKLFILENDDGKLIFGNINQWNEFKTEIDEAFKYAERLGGLI